MLTFYCWTPPFQLKLFIKILKMRNVVASTSKISHLSFLTYLLFNSTMWEVWFPWQTMVQTPMVDSFSLHMLNSLILIWNTLYLPSTLFATAMWSYCICQVSYLPLPCGLIISCLSQATKVVAAAFIHLKNYYWPFH